MREVNVISNTKTVFDKTGQVDGNEVTIIRYRLHDDGKYEEVIRAIKVVPSLQFLDILQIQMQYDNLINL